MDAEVLTVELLSDTTFSANFGCSVDVDVEVDHDDFGCPVVSGKAIRGLLRDTWLSCAPLFPEMTSIAGRLFGAVGDLNEAGILRIGQGTIDARTRGLIVNAVRRERGPTRRSIFLAFTTVRRQTAEERSTGAPAEHSLRSSRVLIRNLRLQAPVHWLQTPTQQDLACLAMVLLGTRHAGCGRNRGRGHIRLFLNNDLKHTVNLMAQLQ